MSSRTYSPMRSMFGRLTTHAAVGGVDVSPVQATATPADGGAAVPCTVTQLTAFGARVAGERGRPLPDSMRIQIPLRHVDSRCRVFWRGASSVGVRFVN